MTVRDWLELLIVPLALVAVGFWFTARQDAHQQDIEDQRARHAQRIEDQRADQAQKIEGQRAEAERDLAKQNAQDEAVQAYLDQMSTLMLEKDLRESKEDSEVRTLARARTLTLLRRLDMSRKGEIIQFLWESDLVGSRAESEPVIELNDADLSGADLAFAPLINADLAGADLSGADLAFASLDSANLGGVDLSSADLHSATLFSANLAGADLSSADLSSADLAFAYLGGADLGGVDLSGADLHSADGLTNGALKQQAKFLKGATMTNGQKYEDWLKDREGRKEDTENE